MLKTAGLVAGGLPVHFSNSCKNLAPIGHGDGTGENALHLAGASASTRELGKQNFFRAYINLLAIQVFTTENPEAIS
jgi:hypothetical protein